MFIFYVKIMFISTSHFKVKTNFSPPRARISNTDRGLSFMEGFFPMLSFLVMVFLFSAWAFLSPAGILDLQPRLFFTATGIVFSNMTVSN